MNLFQKIKKNNLIRNITEEKYFSSDFKDDFDVYYALVRKNPSSINKLQYGCREKILEIEPSFVDYLNNSFLVCHLREKPQLIDFVRNNRSQIITHLKIEKLFECIQYLSIEEQGSIIRGFINNSEFYKYFDKTLIIDTLSNNNENVDISKCNEELQLLIVKANNKYISSCNSDVLKQYLSSNPNFTYQLDYELLYNNIGIIKELISNNIIDRKELFRNLFFKYGMKELTQEFLNNSDFNEFKLELVNAFWPGTYRDIDNRKELFNVNPKANAYWMNNDINIVKEYIYNRLKEFNISTSFAIGKDDINNILLILSNDNIMRKIDTKNIQHFLNNPSYEHLIKIVENIYGSECANILKNRPKLNANLIPTLDIFDKKVVDTFGYQNIQNFLTYENKSFLVLESLIKDDNLLNKYIQFRDITSSYYNDNTFIDLEKQLIAFYDMKEFLLKIDLNSLNAEQKNNLLEFINDKYIDNNNNITMHLDTLEQLSNYNRMRNEKYDKHFIEANDIFEIKSCIYERFFGLINNKSNIYKLQQASSSIIDIYNIEVLLKSEKINDYFNDTEIKCLKLLLMIDKIDDVETLKDLYKELKKNDSIIINPIDFKDIREKIPQIYANDIVKNLFNPDDVKSTTNGVIVNEPIDYKGKKIKVVTLNGEKFNLLVHAKTLGSATFNLTDRTLVDRMSIYNSFINGEEGMSTISCSTISNENYFHHNANQILLGFNNIDAEDILAMGAFDINTSHNMRSLNPTSEANFDFLQNLNRKVANRFVEKQSTDAHGNPYTYFAAPYAARGRYNEVVLSRRHHDTRKIKEDDKTGGRIMPSCVVAIDKIQPLTAELAAQFDVPIVIINTKAYGFNNNYDIEKVNYTIEELTNETNELLGRKR